MCVGEEPRVIAVFVGFSCILLGMRDAGRMGEVYMVCVLGREGYLVASEASC